jgi:fructose-1,6-bisphosphatase/inositol monophosphatase family enzyme
MDLIKILEELEPVFIEAGKLACKMQKNINYHDKFSTGSRAIDIVTEADLAVQEFLLEAMSKTELVNCHLMAEEDTPSVKKFNENGKYYLVIDPIDGTAVYANGGNFFSVIVSLHDGVKPLYTFIYFPALKWTHKIVNGNYSVSGETPKIFLPDNPQNTVIYWSGNPEKTIPDVFKKLKNNGIVFTKIDSNSSSIALFSCDKVAGIYKENINVYDGLVEFSIALAKKQKIYSGGPKGTLDLSDIQKREYGLYYPGYYLALNKLS